MTVITTADADWDVLTDVRDTLADAEISEGVPAFRQVVLGENADDFTATVTQTPAALVRLVGQQEEATGDSGDGHVALLEIEILIRTRKADARNAAANRMENLDNLLNLAANALMTDPTRDGNAEAAIVSGKLHPATRIGKRRSLKSAESFATASLQVTFALPVTDTGR